MILSILNFGFASIGLILSKINAITISATLIGIFGFSFIIFFHELGHYTFARMFGVKIAEFSIGFGSLKWLPRYKDRNGTVWKIGPMPLGGYVGILSEPSIEDSGAKVEDMSIINIENTILNDNYDEASIDGIYLRECNQFKKILIFIAGPLFNIILSFFIMSFVFFRFGAPVSVFTMNYDLGGLYAGDIICKVNNVEPLNRQHFVYLTKDTNKFTIIRRGCIVEKVNFSLPIAELLNSVPEHKLSEALQKSSENAQSINSSSQVELKKDNPAKDEPKKESNPEDEQGKQNRVKDEPKREDVLEVEIKTEYLQYEDRYFPERRKSILDSATASAEFTYVMSIVSLQSYGKLFSGIGKGSLKKSIGPLGMMYGMIKKTIDGPQYLLVYLAVISIILGVFNLIPLPPLDGGHIFFTILEVFFGKSKILEKISHYIAITAILVLLSFSAFADLQRPVALIYSKISHLIPKNKSH